LVVYASIDVTVDPVGDMRCVGVALGIRIGHVARVHPHQRWRDLLVPDYLSKFERAKVVCSTLSREPDVLGTLTCPPLV
jgi:hypothetical protein